MFSIFQEKLCDILFGRKYYFYELFSRKSWRKDENQLDEMLLDENYRN